MIAHAEPSLAVQEAARAHAADTIRAMVAAHALMARADGKVLGAERRRFFAIRREHPATSVFSREQIADAVAEHAANFRCDPEFTQEFAREKLATVAGSPRGVRQVVAACRALIPADGVAHPGEYRMLARTRTLHGVGPGLSPFRQSHATA